MTAIVKQNSELIARRWAKALMELAAENDGISKEDILDDLKEVSENINSSQALKEAINNPSISVEEKQIILCKLFQSKLMPIVYNFIIALNLKKRINIIDVIAQEFEKELEEIKNIVRVKVTSAIEINEEKKNEIKNKISEKLQKNTVIEWNTDANIIAGLVFNINETIIDNSIKHKLENLSKNIIKG